MERKGRVMKEVSRVTHAVIMAAGTGKRMRPLTLDVPKPLIRVKGVRIIDTIIRGLRINGIYDIYIVTGYLKEQFEPLTAEYPGVRLIENPCYNSCNNISSLYAAREYLGECMILDGDQIICSPSVLEASFTLSGYNAVWTDERTDEWVMDVENGIVKGCSRNGGAHGWQLYSVSRWTQEDGRRLRRHIEDEFEKGNRDIYWDDIALFCYPQCYRLGIKQMKKGDVIEVDTVEELAVLDSSYREGGDERNG